MKYDKSEKKEKYLSNGSNKKIQDVILKLKQEEVNIVILNLGTGSFLDILTRHGSLTIHNILVHYKEI